MCNIPPIAWQLYFFFEKSVSMKIFPHEYSHLYIIVIRNSFKKQQQTNKQKQQINMANNDWIKFAPMPFHLLSRIKRKRAFCICENKDADQLRSNADQRLCFRHEDSAIPLISKCEFSSLYPSSVAVQSGLFRIWSEIQKTGFLTTRFNL